MHNPRTYLFSPSTFPFFSPSPSSFPSSLSSSPPPSSIPLLLSPLILSPLLFPLSSPPLFSFPLLVSHCFSPLLLPCFFFPPFFFLLFPFCSLSTPQFLTIFFQEEIQEHHILQGQQVKGHLTQGLPMPQGVSKGFSINKGPVRGPRYLQE